jgi:hypothetical protein
LCIFRPLNIYKPANSHAKYMGVSKFVIEVTI